MEINRKRVARRLASGLVAGALAFGGLALSGASPAGAVPLELDADQRIGGSDRWSTASLIAEELEDQLDAAGDELETIIVVNGENFPDALASAPLAGDSAAILPVTANLIPSAIKDRMLRFADTVLDVYVVGGTSAVSEAVYAEIEDIFEDADIERISGADRYATAAAVGSEVGLDGGVVAIVSGAAYADAVSIGGWAATLGVPVLLANGDGLPSATTAALEEAYDEDEDTVAIIVGGPSAVSSSVESDLIDIGYGFSNIHRVAGPDRYVTNLIWNAENFGGLNKYMPAGNSQALEGNVIMFASGANFPDALSAAPLAANLGAHLVLVDPVTVGASALTLATLGKTSIPLDGLGALGITDYAVSASLTDDMVLDHISAQANLLSGGTAGEGDDYFGQDLWVIGGTSAVPAAGVSTIVAASESAVTCSISVAGANDSSTVSVNPRDFVIAFSADVTMDSNDSSVGELSLLDATSIVDYLEIEGDDLNAAVTTVNLDLDGNGFTDAVKVTTVAAGTDELDQGFEIDFLGWDEDAEDYTTTGAGLREFSPCSATVGRDRTAPTMDIYGVDTAIAAGIVYVEFSEPLGYSATAWTTEVGTMLTASSSGGASTCIAVQLDQAFQCTTTTAIDTTDTFDFSTTAFHDRAGNAMSEAANGDTWVTTAGAVDGPELEDVTATCKAQTTSSQQATRASTGWVAKSGITQATDATAFMAFEDAGDGFRITAQSGNRGLSANDWTFTIEHQRGLLVPTLDVDGTDVVITIDQYFHTDTDIKTLLDRSAIGTGGAAAKLWSVTDANSTGPDGALVDESVIGEEYSPSGTGGTEGEVSCLFTLTLDGPMNSSVAAGSIGVSAAPTNEGEVAIRIGGNYQTDLDCDYASYTAAGVTGTTIYCMVQGTTDTGSARVEILTQYMDDATSDGDVQHEVISL